MRISSLLFVLFISFISLTANAATVLVNDGDVINYDAANDYIFLGSLSAANPIVTYGVNVEPGEVLNFVINAPVEFDLGATLTTGPNGTGTGLISPNSLDLIFAGTSLTMPIDGNYVSATTAWLSIGLGPEAQAYVTANFVGGELPISSLGGYVPPNVSAVPIPAAAFMLAPALLGFMSLRKRLAKEKV